MKTCRKCKETKPLKEFNTAKSCKYGIMAQCKLCVKKRSAKWYKENVTRVKTQVYAWRNENSDKFKEYVRQWHVENIVERNVAANTWYKNNKERHRIMSSNWDKLNRDKKRSHGAKYRAKKLQRTPKWLTEGDWIEINRMYSLAHEKTYITGIKHEVDHIIPLQGKNISGLHVPSNLQILTKSKNSSKRNGFTK